MPAYLRGNQLQHRTVPLRDASLRPPILISGKKRQMLSRYAQKTIVSTAHFMKNGPVKPCALPLQRSTMFRIAFIIGLILTACSISVTASPLPQPAEDNKKPDDNYLKIAKQIITRYDKDDDKKLSTDEWKKMLLSPAKADVNKDQQITVDEYARWARSKDRSKKAEPNRPAQTKPQPAPQKPKADGPKPAPPQKFQPQKLQQLKKPQPKNTDELKLVRENREKQEEQREQQLVEQIERELEQREQREREETKRRAMEQRERVEIEQNRRREIEERERDEMEQNRRRERGQRERNEMEQNQRREREQRERDEMNQNQRREREQRDSHEGNTHWENQIRSLEEARAQLHREHEDVARRPDENHTRRMAIRSEMDKLDAAMEEIFQKQKMHQPEQHERHDSNTRQHGNHHEDGNHHDNGEHHGHGNDGEHRHDPRHDGEMPAEKRIELLRIAFDHLAEAGMHDLAEEAWRRAKDMEQEIRRDNGPDREQVQHLIEESHRAIHAVNQRLDQVQRELQEMREQFNQLRNQR